MTEDREQRLARLEARVQAGEVEAWKVALLREWAALAPADAARPTLEELTGLLARPEVRRRLTRVEGPWDVLFGQAGSHEAHRQVGAALQLLADVLQG